MVFFPSTKQAIEGVPMIPNPGLFFGHLLLMRDPDFRRVMHKFSVEHADSKGRCSFWMGNVAALSVTAAADVQIVLKNSSHRSTFSLMTRHVEHFLGARSIAVLTGREWKTQRTAITKALHTTVSHEAHGRSVVSATQVLVDALLKKAETAAPLQFELGELMKLLTLDIFGQTAMNVNFGCCESLQPSLYAAAFDFLASEMMRRMTTGIIDPSSQIYCITTSRNRRQAQQREFLQSYISDRISERQQLEPKEFPNDLLTAMIQVKDLSEDELVDTLLSLLFAGYETTASTLSYTIYLISRDASVEQQCLKEIDRLDTISAKPSDYAYLQAVLMETLRLYPPVISTTRSIEKELVLDGIPVPSGTYLYIPIWTIQRDPNNFSDPTEFLPERWVVADAHTGHWTRRDPPEHLGNVEAWIPFSAGARNCAGRAFAMHEMTLTLAVLLKNLRFQPPEDYDLIPYREGLVQTPKGGLPVTVSKRPSRISSTF
jgi:cytochrome P450 family 4